jgi:hypothetical protein
MTDRDLGRALLELDAATLAGKDDVAGKTTAILQRDRFRLRALTWSTMAVWLLALMLIFGDLVFFGLLFPREAQFREQVNAGQLTPQERTQIHDDLFIAFHVGTLVIAFSVFITTLAAFLTVLLILATRRATQRQPPRGSLPLLLPPHRRGNSLGQLGERSRRRLAKSDAVVASAVPNLQRVLKPVGGGCCGEAGRQAKEFRLLKKVLPVRGFPLGDVAGGGLDRRRKQSREAAGACEREFHVPPRGAASRPRRDCLGL